MDTIIYTRQSMDSTGEGLAVARQEQSCRAYAAEHGWDVVAVLSDNSISATTGKRRPGFEAVLTHPVKQVVVWHQDRLLRVSRDLERVLDAGLTVHQVSAGSLDLASPTGKAVARTVAAWTTYEGEQKAARQRLSNTQRAAKGKPPAGGRRAFGYTADGMDLVEDEAQMVGWAYEQGLAGASLKGMARLLEDKRFTTPQGKPWARDSVRYLLTNPRYAGLRVLRGQIVGKGTWERIVDEDSWRAVQVMLSDPTRRKSTDTRSKWLLTGIATCGTCGSAMSTGYTSHRSRVYKCQHADLAVQAAPVDAYVQEVILQRLSRPDALDLIQVKPDTAPLLAERARLTERLDDLAAAYATEAVTLNQMTTATQTLMGRLDEIEGLLGSLYQDDILLPLAGCKRLRDLWAGMEISQQRAVVRALFDQIVLESPGRGTRTFRPEKVRLEWRGCEPGSPAALG